jgi:hypothetical protein
MPSIFAYFVQTISLEQTSSEGSSLIDRRQPVDLDSSPVAVPTTIIDSKVDQVCYRKSYYYWF